MVFSFLLEWNINLKIFENGILCSFVRQNHDILVQSIWLLGGYQCYFSIFVPYQLQSDKRSLILVS